MSAVTERFKIAQDGLPPSETQLREQRFIQRKIMAAADAIDLGIPGQSREKSLAITKLEEALMWAGKALFA